MGTLSARNLRESLAKARNVGIVEERVTLFADAELVVRNLRPDEYEAIARDCEGQDGLEYLYAFQEGHVKRAIVELNGLDLRDVQFIEDEEEDPKKPGQTKTVKLELHDWLQKNILSTWSKEALYVVFRKVEDAVGRAETKAKEGIEFITPDETDEDRFRRMAGELKELEGNLPAKLVDHVLDDVGYMRKSAAEEIKKAMERADQLAREAAEAAKKGEGGGTPPQTPPAASAPPASPAPPPAAPATPVAAKPGQSVEELMRNRQPLNQSAAEVPQPVIITPTVRQSPVPVTRQQQGVPPDQVHPPLGAIPGPQPHGSAAARAAKNAALEADADAAGALVPGGVQLPGKPQVPVIEQRLGQVDPKAAASIMDPKPKGGINPHYRNHNRGGL